MLKKLDKRYNEEREMSETEKISTRNSIKRGFSDPEILFEI